MNINRRLASFLGDMKESIFFEHKKAKQSVLMGLSMAGAINQEIPDQVRKDGLMEKLTNLLKLQPDLCFNFLFVVSLYFF